MPGLAAIERPAPLSVRCTLSMEDAISDLTWSSDSRMLLIGTAAGKVHRLDPDGTLAASWQAHSGGVTRLALRPGQESTLASAGEDGRVVLWDVVSAEQTALLGTENGWVEHLAWTPDGKVLASAARKTISLWRGSESLGIWYDARRQVLAMAWAPDSRRLATAANKGLYLWRMEGARNNSSEPMQLLSFPGAPVALAWRPNGRALAVGTQDGFLQVWRQATQEADNDHARQLTMRGYPSKVNCLAWHPRRGIIATAGGPDVVLWELPEAGKGACAQPLRHHQNTVTTLTWSADGQLLASGDRSGRLCIWDRDGDAVFSRQLTHEISTLQWQPCGDTLAAGDTGGGLHLLGRNQLSSEPYTL